MQDSGGLISWEMGLYKIPVVSSLGTWGYTRYQGPHHWGCEAIQDTRVLITGEGAIQDTSGLVTGEVGYTRYQGSHHLEGGRGYLKVPSPQDVRVGP